MIEKFFCISHICFTFAPMQGPNTHVIQSTGRIALRALIKHPAEEVQQNQQKVCFVLPPLTHL